MLISISLPRQAAVWSALALAGILLQGCGQKPSAPQGAQPRLFASDFQGEAKNCTASKPELTPGKETAATISVANDGGWCAISVTDGGKPYATGLLIEPPSRGSVYVHPVGNATRIDYTPDAGFSGNDTFTVRLLPESPVLRVAVTVAR